MRGGDRLDFFYDPLDDFSLNPTAWAKYEAEVAELETKSNPTDADKAELEYGKKVIAAAFLTDEAKKEWSAATATGAALRVRWSWRWAQMQLAPDTKEFRIYLNTGRFGTFEGRVEAVVSASANGAGSQYWVQTDMKALEIPGGIWKQAVLRIDQRPFQVLGASRTQEGKQQFVFRLRRRAHRRDRSSVQQSRAGRALAAGTGQ